MTSELEEKAQKLLEAAAEYWEEYNKIRSAGGAVVWLEDQNGRCVVITRGEYRDRMMAAVGEHISEPHFFGNCPECDGVGCEECGGTGKYSG